MERYYRIAGLTVKLDSFGRTVTQAEPYACPPAEPDMTVCTDWRELQSRQPHLSDEDSEYIATCSDFYRKLLDFDGMMLHASAVVVDGRAYLFSADSGTGKSTHTQLWLKAFGDRAQILNDDKPALRLEDGTWYAYGTPWSGKYDLNANLRVPLAGIALLERGEQNTIEPFAGSGAVYGILEQTMRPWEPRLRGKLLVLLDKLLRSVPLWKLKCNMELEAARIAYAAMAHGQEKDLCD